MSLANANTSSKQWWHFVPSLLVLLGITYLSLVKDVPFVAMEEVPFADKWGHMVAYLVFSLCLASDSYHARLKTWQIYTLAVLFPVIYGGLIELIQPHFPPRQGEWIDWLADCVGTGIGVGLFAAFQVWSRRRHSSSLS